MQYYLNGFHAGDPAVQPADTDPHSHSDLPQEVDVLIVGAGPAGLLLAAQLSQFPEVSTHLVERKPGPLELGQADGIACRTTEMLAGFGLSETLLREAYWVNETTFWGPACDDRTQITRTGRVQDTEDGLSEFPHVIVNQARIHDYLLGFMGRSATRMAPHYGLEFRELRTDRTQDHPVEVTVRDVDGGELRTVRAKYVVGCDGARSGVRTAIGRELRGDRAHHAWGVMDVLAHTDFPDIRFKTAIQSTDHGSILIIPREGGYLVRLYVDLGTVTGDNRDRIRSMSVDDVVDVARMVLHPYRFDVQETVWFSIYEVAQRLTDAFDDAAGTEVEPRVFIAGDACHTHSAKAGQGMNVSMQDAFNLGWKLAAVLRGHSKPALLQTYSKERQPVAQELIDFDREWSAMMASRPTDPEHPEQGGLDSSELSSYYARQGRYTAGVATHYRPGLLTGSGRMQSLATGFEVGTRLHSHPVTRVADARPMHLAHAAAADGRWRLYLFADATMGRLRDLCKWLETAPDSPIRAHRAPGQDVDALIDVRAVLQQPHQEVVLADLPDLLVPRKGRYDLTDYEKVFTAAGVDGPDIFAARGINRQDGCMLVVRPDQYVSDVLDLRDTTSLTQFFGQFMRAPATLDA